MIAQGTITRGTITRGTIRRSSHRKKPFGHKGNAHTGKTVRKLGRFIGVITDVPKFEPLQLFRTFLAFADRSRAGFIRRQLTRDVVHEPFLSQRKAAVTYRNP
jgi:hypothetical protein